MKKRMAGIITLCASLVFTTPCFATAVVSNEAVVEEYYAEDKGVEQSSYANSYNAGYTFRVNDAWYKVLSNGCVTYLRPHDTDITWAVIPNQVKRNGVVYKVIKISVKAFYGCENLKKAKIGKNITAIGQYAFKNTPNMKEIIVLGKDVDSVTHAFVGAGLKKGEDLKVQVPYSKKNFYEYLFKDEGGMNNNATFVEGY